MVFSYLLTGIIVLADLAFILISLFATRTGMEAMGVLFILWPLAAFHLLLGGTYFFRKLWKKLPVFPAYFIIATIIMAGCYYLYVDLKPQGSSVYRVLVHKTQQKKKELVTLKERKALKARQLIEKTQDKNHADLCRALPYPRDLEALKNILKRNPDLSKTCALIKGETALPIFAVLIEDYTLWERQPRSKRSTIMDNTRSTVSLLLEHGADPNSRDALGNTPLHWALRYQDEQLATQLLEHQACVFMENSHGQPLVNDHFPYRLKGVVKLLAEAAKKPEMVELCSQFSKKKVTKTQQTQPDKSSVDRWTKQLLRASEAGSLGLAAQAIEHGANPNTFNRDDLAALHLATKCQPESSVMITMLLAAGADINGYSQKKYSLSAKPVTPILTAVYNHCPKSVAILLGKGADPNFADRDGYTALHHIASSWSQKRMAATVDQLLAAGADINARDKLGRTPLMMTAYAGEKDPDPETIFLTRGADPNLADRGGNTFIYQLVAGASRKDPAPIIANLIKSGAAVDQSNDIKTTPLMLAVKKRKINCIKQLLTAGASSDKLGKRGASLLYSVVSCQPKYLDVLETLLAAGSDVNIRNTDGQTPLHRALAANTTCRQPAEMLLAAKADPNLQDQLGATPLHKLIYRTTGDSAPLIKLMRQHKAKLNIKDKGGNTPLLLAGFDSSGAETLQALLSAGANPTLTDNYGNTLLHHAAVNPKSGVTKRIEILLTVTPDPKQRNDEGKTALDLARQRHNNEAIVLLESINK